MKKIYFLRLIIILFFPLISYNQTIKRFTPDSVRFMIEIKYFMTDITDKPKKEAMELFMVDFEKMWKGGKLSETRKQAVYKTTNTMLKGNYKQIPHFQNYLQTLITIANANFTENNFINWDKAVTHLLSLSNKNRILSYLDATRDLLTDSSIYKSASVRWITNNTNYNFGFEDVPFISFPSLDLKCVAKRDSAIIFKTSGIFYPLDEKWVGKNGTVTWERAGFPAEEVYATFTNYSIAIKFSNYQVDTVTFFNRHLFKTALKGKLEEKVMADVTAETATYPRFFSFDKRIVIKQIFKDIDYSGGYTLQGSRFLGQGNDEEPAQLTFFLNKKKFVDTKALSFIIRKDRITSDEVSVSIYHKSDSIFHPNLQMKYMDNDKELSLIRLEKGLSQSPFYNTYHKLEMSFEALRWRLGTKTIYFSMIKGFSANSEAMFESSNYYTSYHYEKIQGIDAENPIQSLRSFMLKNKTNKISVAEMCKLMRAQEYQAIGMLVNLSMAGFVQYNSNTKIATINDKVELFAKARSGRSDYDVIRFHSVTQGKDNAVLDLDSFNLQIRGVSKIILSDSQQVTIYPTDQEITMKKNRDFKFNGVIRSGLFDFYGKNFFFDYDNFKVNLVNTDSMRFKIKEGEMDEYGNYTFKQVRTVLEKINGELLIDNPSNKSGRLPMPTYPIFKSNNESFVYYDKRFIQKGVYDRTKFYFQVKPFVIDSLDNTGTEGIAFNGTFISGGVFPDMEDNLIVQKDYSLGMTRNTGDDGYPVYGGKGRYYNKIHLSYEGLIGDGTLTYLNSTTLSDKFVFLLDSMNANVKTYDISEMATGKEYPQVHADSAYQHWRPYKDVMVVRNDVFQDNEYEMRKMKQPRRTVPIDMFHKKAKFVGITYLTPKQLSGNGTMYFFDAELMSRNFKYKHHEFMADTADFKLKSLDLQEYALLTNNYNSHIDLQKMHGKFKSNGGVAKIEFPINQYISYMDEFDWFINEKDVALRNTKAKLLSQLDKMNLYELMDVNLAGSDFVSVHPKQDSLRFFSARANYNLNNNIIHAKDVKIIKVADAAIYPDSGLVNIQKRAEIETLRKAKIIADTAKNRRHHLFYEANLNITGRKKYYGSGVYDYIDENKKAQQIFFNKIEVVDSLVQTQAFGSVSEDVHFTLSPQFDFKGDIKITAPKKFLNFDGGTRINTTCKNIGKPWISFNADINPDTIKIPISEQPRDLDNKKLYAGIFIAFDTNQIYSSFIGYKLKFSDTMMVSSKGILTFHKATKEWRIASPQKLAKRDSVPGNYLSLSSYNCEIYGEGKLNLGLDFGQLKLESYGNLSQYTNADSSTFNLLINLDFFFNQNAIKVFSDDLNANIELKGVDYNTHKYRKIIATILGTDRAQKLFEEIELYGALKRLPDELVHTLVISDIKMRWDIPSRSYISYGKIGIGNVGKTQVDKYIDGHVQLIRKRGIDVLNIYLEPSPGVWYYFSYTQNLMQGISSNEAFNQPIRDTKPEDRNLKVEKGQMPYTYYISTERKKSDFIKSIQKNK